MQIHQKKIVMQKHIALICAVFLYFNLSAQNIEKIIDKHIKAHGGIKKFEAITNMKISGKFTAFSVEKDFSLIKTDKGCYYSKCHYGKHEVTEVFCDSEGWTINPWFQLGFPRKLNNNEITASLQKADLFTPFFEYNKKGHKVELVGKQDLEGTQVFAVKLTRKNGDEETWYLDANTFLEVKYESTWVDFSRACKAETFFDDFREVNGMKLPFYIERNFIHRNRIMQIEKVEVNTEIEEALFDFPKNEALEKLGFLVGKWNVKLERQRRGKWQKIDSTLSRISYESENLLQERMTYEKTFPNSVIVNYAYNKASQKYTISLYNSFGSGILVFEGSFANDTLVANNVNESVWKDKPGSLKLTISGIKQDEFTLALEQSKDEGKTWKPTDRFSYKRQE